MTRTSTLPNDPFFDELQDDTYEMDVLLRIR